MDSNKFTVEVEIIEQNIYKFGEGLYVWYDEAGLVGGASNTYSEARKQLMEYSIHYL